MSENPARRKRSVRFPRTVLIALVIALTGLSAAIAATALPGTANWTQIGEAPNIWLGTSASSAGDVNGDGYDDIVASAPGYASEAGKAYVYLGSAGGIVTPDAWSRQGESAGDLYGWDVGRAGDVNGDGYDDIIIGAPDRNSGTGKAYVYHGSASGVSGTHAWSETGQSSGNSFGGRVADAGDVNGDGYDDVIISAHSYSSSTGRAYVYTGSASGLGAIPSWTATGEVTSDMFGSPVAAAGDLNGDGYDDVVVGATKNASNTGKAYVYFGSASGLSVSPDWTAVGESASDFFGTVAGAGDVNRDGFSDLIIAASSRNLSTGKAYLYLGSAAGPASVPSWDADGANAGDNFGNPVATLGDINGDGYADVGAGATGASWSTGAGYVFQGSPTGPSTVADWTGTGSTPDSYFGESVGSAGDVNGDGVSDLLVGGSGGDGYRGFVHVYHGSDQAAPELAFGAGAKPSEAYVRRSISVPASVIDYGTGVSGVRLYDGSSLKTTDTSSPFGFTLDTTTLPNGSRTIGLSAYDVAGNVSSKTTRIYRVDNYKPRTYTKSPSKTSTVKKGKYVRLYYKVKDPYTSTAYVKIKIKTLKGKTKKTIKIGWKKPGSFKYYGYKAKLPRGKYRYFVYATDKAGNTQNNVAKKRLTIR